MFKIIKGKYGRNELKVEDKKIKEIETKNKSHKNKRYDFP